MRWEELTSDDFPQAVAASQGVCLLPLSVVERHAHHLPMATDTYIARDLCRRAAEIEPALIFPDFIFTQILEAQHCAGTIALDPDLILSLLDNVCREIARNGLRKIVLVNAHGGNHGLIGLFLQKQLASPRDYVVYVTYPPVIAADDPAEVGDWSAGDHAGAQETAAVMAIRPDLVHFDRVRADGEGDARGRLKALTDLGTTTGIWWYADHPTHYAGDASPATAEKGERWLAARGKALARAIRAIKADDETLRLQQAFFAAAQH
ncbi:MAG: creatininase family protein [Anaerolineae bacterium]|nr:creatininase family protein [Anaerolineae bacterium]